MIKSDKNSIESMYSMRNNLGLGNKVLSFVEGGANLKDIRVQRKQGHVYNIEDSIKMEKPSSTSEELVRSEIEYLTYAAENMYDMSKVRAKIVDAMSKGYNVSSVHFEATKRFIELSEKDFNRIQEDIKSMN